MNRKLIVFLLTISLLLSMLPAGALAEELDAPVEESFEAEISDLLDQEDISEPLEVEAVEDEEPDYVEEAEPLEIDGTELTDDEVESFTPRYARVVEPVNSVYDDAFAIIAENLPVDSIVYVFDSDADGIVQLAYNAEGQIVLGRMDAMVLVDLDADAVDALKAESTENSLAFTYFDDDPELPLPLIAREEAVEAEQPLKLSAEKVELTTGETLALTVENADHVTWTSDDEEVATVSEDGVVTATGIGRTDITAVDGDGRTAVCTVRVAMLAAPGILPDKVAFNVSSLKIGEGEKSTALKVILGTDPDVNYIRDLTFSSSKTKYVTVDENGMLVGIKKGTSTITVTTSNGKKATCKVSVKSAPTKVTISQKSLKLNVGETSKLTAKLNSSSAAGAITWSSSDEDIAEVDPDTGVVTAVDAGVAKITAKTYNDKTATLSVTVKAAPTDLSFDETEITLGAKQKVTMAAKLNPGAECDITYHSSDTKVVSIKGTTFTAVAAGEATITASVYNGLTATCHFIVEAAPKSVKLPFKTLEIGEGDTYQLEPVVDGCATGLTYTAGSKKYVTVTKDGLLTAEKVGTTYVTIRTYNKKSFKLKVIVKKAPTSLEFSPDEMEMGVGEISKVGLKVSNGSSASVTLKSSKPSVVEVNSDTGEVTALKIGTATITAETYNGLTATCKVSVYPAPTAIEFDEDDIEMAVGDTYKTGIELIGGRSNVTYESDNTKIATISSTGIITGKAAGKTTVRAMTTIPGLYAEADVRVWGAPGSIKLQYSKIGIEVEEGYQIEPIIPDNTRTTFTYKSSNSKVVSVDEDGWIEGVGLGTAAITVTTHNGKSARLTVIVSDPYYPTALKLKGSVPVLDVDDGYQINYVIEPDTADTDIIWSSSNEKIVTVDEDGYIFAEGKGTATITAIAVKNPKLKLTIKVQVGESSGGGGSSWDDYELTTEIPDRITDEYDIEENLEKIEAIRESALSEIDRMEDEDIISSSDASKRRSIINNIFDCYAFPWMTLKYQDYWKAKNSEGGVKDFKPGNVYYGLPYISGSGNNRHYNVTKALNENRYYDSGDGYYILNQKKLLSGKYVGNDCSGLVDVAIWGTGSSHSDDRTKDIASSSAYRTIKDYKAMRTGDLICKGGSHVVMFLYYVNDAKTQFMMIENGGEEAGTNTVHCDIYPTSYYSSRSYKVRRLSSLG